MNCLSICGRVASPPVRYCKHGYARAFVPPAYSRLASTWQTCLDQLQYNNDINAFLSIPDRDVISAQGNASDQRHKQGSLLGPLDGMPIAVKDNFCTTTLPTTCGSRMLENFESPYEATVIRLIKEAGAILMGKTNMDEFGMGSANIYSHGGPVVNPHSASVANKAEQRVAGGSSGGSAAAVAAGMCVAALGSDTGGSVRLPASYCGVVGFKPSYGRCSRHGLVAYANSLDTVGILSRTVADAKTVYDTIARYDELDPTSLPEHLWSPLEEANNAILDSLSGSDDLSGIVVGVPQEYFVHPLASDVVDSWRTGIQSLKARGASIVSVSLPHTPHALPSYFIIALAEASSNLARYDGIRYGHRSKEEPQADGLLYADTRSEGFGSEVKRRILMGTHILTSGTYERHFLPAQKARHLIRKDFDNVFIQPNPLVSETAQKGTQPRVHVILTPSAVSTAPRIQDCIPSSDRLRDPSDHHVGAADAYLNDVMTVPASLAGLPAVSVPFHRSPKDGYPIGLQLISQYGYDRLLLRVADVLANAAS